MLRVRLAAVGCLLLPLVMVATLEQCALLPSVDMKPGHVNVVALLDPSICQFCVKQAAMLHQLRGRLLAANFTDVHFTVFSPGGAATLEELRAAAPGIPVYPDPPPHTPWGRLLAGQQNNILVFDTACGGRGRLAYQVIMPWSMLHYPYVKAAILSTYNDDPCGACPPQDTEATDNKLGEGNATQFSPPSNTTTSHHSINRLKLTSIVDQYKPIVAQARTEDTPVANTQHNTTSEANRRHHVGGWVMGLAGNKKRKHGKEKIPKEEGFDEELWNKNEGRVVDNTNQGDKRTDIKEETSCNELEEDSDGCYDPTLKLVPLQELPDGTVPIRVIMSSPNGHMGDKRYEFLELQLGNPRYHGHLDKHGKRIEAEVRKSKARSRGHLDEHGTRIDDQIADYEHKLHDHGHLDEHDKRIDDKIAEYEQRLHHHGHLGDHDKRIDEKVIKPDARMEESEEVKTVTVGHLNNSTIEKPTTTDQQNNDTKEDPTTAQDQEGRKKPDPKQSSSKKKTSHSKAKKPSTKSKTLIDLDTRYKPEDKRMHDKLHSSSDDAAYDHHVDEFNDGHGDVTFEDSDRPRTMPWEDKDKNMDTVIVDYMPSGVKEKQLVKTYKELVPGYDGRELEIDERDKGRKKVEPMDYEADENWDDEYRRNSDQDSSEVKTTEVMSSERGYSKVTNTEEGSTREDFWGTKETVEKKKKPIKPVKYDSSSDSSSQGEVLSREMAVARFSEEKVSAQRDWSAKTVNSLDSTRKKVSDQRDSLTGQEDTHASMKKNISSRHYASTMDVNRPTHDSTREKTSGNDSEREKSVDILSEEKRKTHHTLKKKLDSNAYHEENVSSHDVSHEKLKAKGTSDEADPADGTKVLSYSSLSNKSFVYDDSLEAKVEDKYEDSFSEKGRLDADASREVTEPHDSLKKKAIQEELSSQEKVLSHYSKLLPWVHYEI